MTSHLKVSVEADFELLPRERQRLQNRLLHALRAVNAACVVEFRPSAVATSTAPLQSPPTQPETEA